MKKFILCLCLVISVSLATIGILSFAGGTKHFGIRDSAGADSGFDAGYGGGSSGGGGYGGGSSGGGGSYGGGGGYDYDYDYDRPSGGSSSSSDSYSYGGGGKSNISYGGFVAIMVLFSVLCAAGLCVPLIIIFSPGRDPMRQQIKKAKKQGMANVDPLLVEFYQMYVDIQLAWMNKDMTPVKHLLTNEMFNMYQMQLQTLIVNEQTNVMKDISFVGGRKIWRKDTPHEAISIKLNVACKDYIVDDKTHNVIHGSAKKLNLYTYEMTFVRNLDQVEQHCPSCGAVIEKTATNGDTCKKCGNVMLNIKNTNYVLSNKKMISQIVL